MKCWIFVHAPIQLWIERWLSDYKRVFDAWEDGGVTGIVVGRLGFTEADGTPTRLYGADPKVYESFGVTPPPPEPRNSEKEKKLQEILDNAAARGWHIMVFSVPGGAGGLPPEEDPYGEVRFAATVQDVAQAFPQVHGVIMDGPGEQHYELAHHHGGELFEIREYERERFSLLGFDVERMERGIAHLRERFHNLTPDLVRYHAPGGLLAGLVLFDLNDDALYWLRSRQEIAIGSMASLRRAMDRLDRKVELGGIPRTATFSSLTGQNYRLMANHFDYIFPKHYYWHRGFDGMYGTVARWVRKIMEWNPALSEQDGFAVVKSLFGLDLPGIGSLMDLELGFPPEFFSQVVHQETRRALDAVGDDDKLICWVSTGRSPHAGDAMPARDLNGILQASQEAGLKRFLFHPDPDLGAPEWHVISRMCGNPWDERKGTYWPSDTWREDLDGYGYLARFPGRW